MTWLAAVGMILCAPQGETVGLRLREWRAELEGRIEAQGDSISATNISLDRTLGLDDAEFAHEVQAYLSLPVLGRFYAGWWGVDYEGDETLTQSITFEDQTFSASTRVHTEVELDVYYLSYEFVLPTIPLGELLKAGGGILAGARGIVADGAIESSGQSAAEDGWIVFPVLGVHGALQVTPWLRVDLEVMGLPVKYGSSSITYFEAFGELVGQLGPVFAGVGYKVVTLDMADHRGDTEFDLDIRLEGFYVTGGVRF